MNSTFAEDDYLTEFYQAGIYWFPIAVLWLFLPLDLYYTFNSTYRDVPWSWKNISKLVANGSLVVISLYNFIYAVTRSSHGFDMSNEDIYKPIIEFVSMALCFILILIHKKWGRSSSELLFGYWLVCSILGISQFRFYDNNETNDYGTVEITNLLSYSLCVVMLLLNCFADDHPQQSLRPPVENPCPEYSSSCPSRLLFIWFDELAKIGYRKPLDDSDLWNLNYSEMTSVVSHQFDKHWNKAIAKNNVPPTVKYTDLNNYEKLQGNLSNELTKGKRKSKPVSIVLPLCKAFGGTCLIGTVLIVLQNLLSFASPLILELLIDFIGSDDPSWKGYLYAIALFGNSLLLSLLLAQSMHRMYLTGLHVRTSLMSAIYKKALRISNSSRKESATGEIVNLMAVDCQNFVGLAIYINMIWTVPFQIAMAVYLLWRLLGPSVLAGLLVLISFIPINGFIANIVKKLQTKLMSSKDERVKIMNEIITGIKVLKLYAWEPCFEAIVTRIRKKETEVLRHIAYYMSSVGITWVCAPFLVGLVIFTIFVYSDPNNVLDAKNIFVSLALINVLRVPLCSLPIVFTIAAQGFVSVKRINNFLNLDELDPGTVTHDSKEDPVAMEHCTFSWDNDGGIILKDITLRVKKGSLVAIVGAVGSGKSSLLSAFLGEMEKINGRVNTKGSIAYVPQIAWIQNATVQDNILFGNPFYVKLYNKVIEACALSQDLEIFPGGDRTEIGEKGINLSGGQKQRVTLARAVYYDSDIYLLDDPLSAVDSHVGKHIFKNVIGPDGLLRDKTRLYVTHGISFLPEADVIVVLKDGSISEMGTYKELMDRKGAFNEFITTHTQDEIEDNDQEQNEFKKSSEFKPDMEELKPEDYDRQGQIIFKKKPNGSVRDSLNSIDSNGCETKKHRSSDNIQSDLIKQDAKESHGKEEKLTEEEKIEIGNVKWKVYKTYIKAIGFKLCFLAIILHILFECLFKSTDVWLVIWSNDSLLVVNGTQDTSRLNRYVMVYAILGFCQGAMHVATDMIPLLGCWLAGVVFHRELLHTFLRLPLSFFDTTPSGRILTRFSKDLDILDCVIPRVIGNFLWCLFLISGTLVVISYSTPIFMVTIIPLAMLYYFIQRYFLASSRQLNRLKSVSISPIYNHFSESISGAVSIRAYKVLDRFINEYGEKMDKNLISYYPSMIADRWLAIRLDMVGNLIILFAAIFAVRAKSSISAGLAGLSVSLALQVAEFFNMMVKISADIDVNIVAAERIKEYTDLKHESKWTLEGRKVKTEWPDKGQVEFKDFTVRYREGLDCVLKGITFSISGGEKVGVVGRTGAGKSSLTLSLFRIIEAASGSILIDGVDISTLGLHTLRSKLTIIPQDPVLFLGSLRLNLDPFELHSDDQIWRALKLSHLNEFVKGLNGELLFKVSEGGDNLSVGQKQLICLARALLRKTKVLILDEATAAVDLETDNLIQKTIRSEFADCTVLTVAHRINTIMDSDRVIVLDTGLIKEFDTPDNLLKNKNSIFYSMARNAGLV